VAEQTPNPDTVEAYVETLRQFLDVEDAREQGVNTQAGGVVVFGGVILSLVASLARTVLARDLPNGWDETTTALFAVAVVGLLTAVTMTLVGVLLPRQSASIAMERIEQYGELQEVSRPKIEVQGELLEGLIRLLAIDRERVSQKTTWLSRAYSSLVIALFSVSALGLILAAEESGLL
jgi:hypothetical protein